MAEINWKKTDEERTFNGSSTIHSNGLLTGRGRWIWSMDHLVIESLVIESWSLDHWLLDH
jgi:hypothetical protein